MMKQKNDFNFIKIGIAIVVILIGMQLWVSYVKTKPIRYTYSTGVGLSSLRGSSMIDYCYIVNNEEIKGLNLLPDDRIKLDLEATYIIKYRVGYENRGSILLDYIIPDSLLIDYPTSGWGDNPYELKECFKCLNVKKVVIKPDYRSYNIGKVTRKRNYYCR